MEYPPAGSDLQAEGTLAGWLTHEDVNWMENDRGYAFPEINAAGVALQTVKEPGGILRLRLATRSGATATFEYRLAHLGTTRVLVAVAWRSGIAKFYVAGIEVGERILA